MKKDEWQAEVQALSQELADLRKRTAKLVAQTLETPGLEPERAQPAVRLEIMLDLAKYHLGQALELILLDWPGDREVG